MMLSSKRAFILHCPSIQDLITTHVERFNKADARGCFSQCQAAYVCVKHPMKPTHSQQQLKMRAHGVHDETLMNYLGWREKAIVAASNTRVECSNSGLPTFTFSFVNHFSEQIRAVSKLKKSKVHLPDLTSPMKYRHEVNRPECSFFLCSYILFCAFLLNYRLLGIYF